MQSSEKHLEIVRRLSHFLDNAIPIPGTKMRVGLDPIIGLIPGIGDAVTNLMSTYIVVIALQMNVSRWTLVRMVFNILIESIVGIIPGLGDIFDAVWKSNERNRKLLENALKNPAGRGIDRWFVILIIVLLLAIFAGTAALAFFFLKWLVEQF